MGGGVARTALGPDIACAGFALATLCGHAQFELDVVKAVAQPSGSGDGLVTDAVANADDHGMGFEVEKVCG